MDNSQSTQKPQFQQSASAETVFTHQMEHRGVTCDVCETKICGFRYKCTQCPNFDLCHSCESKGHHPGHIMMRISFPEQSMDTNHPFNNGAHESFPFRRRCSLGDRRRFRCGRNMWDTVFRDVSERYANYYTAEPKTTATDSGNAKAENSTPESPIDLAAASLQIQELLNAWGIPVNVAELCSQYGIPVQTPNGNSSAPQTEGKDTTETKKAEGMQHSGTAPPQPTAGNTTETGNTSPLFNLLSNALQSPQVQQIIQGVATAAENATKNISPSTSTQAPTWTDIFHQFNANTTTSAATEAATKKQQDDINTSTLNQLLSMGFTNEDDWLARLVIAKKGNLEAVLNSLSPPTPSK